jgi:hypothetical protein
MHVVVLVKVNEVEEAVIVENAEDILHARLAAYYYFYGRERIAAYEDVKAKTSVRIGTHGPVNAAIFSDIFARGPHI